MTCGIGGDRNPCVSRHSSNRAGAPSADERREALAWLISSLETAPASIRPVVAELVASLTADAVSTKAAHRYWRQLARALGLIASTERRRSGNPLGPIGARRGRKTGSAREQVVDQLEECKARAAYHEELAKRQQDKMGRLAKKIKTMSDNKKSSDVLSDTRTEDTLTIDTPLEEIPLSDEQKASAQADAKEFAKHLALGEGTDPTLQMPHEALMSGNVVSIAEESVSVEAKLPDGISEESVVKTLTETRERFDFTFQVTRVEIEVEKKVVVTSDEHGEQRRVISASTEAFGPPRFSVTWSAMATLAVLVGQFAMPLNRLATILSTPLKRFTVATLSRMLHYVAMRLVPIYLALADELADSAIWSGDDTSCRVVEVSSYLERVSRGNEKGPPPWAAYRTQEEAKKTYAAAEEFRNTILKLRSEGDREARGTLLEGPPLTVVVGRNLGFESPRRNGQGPKQALNTTVLTGRGDADDPRSTIVFYRSHLGSLGNLLEMLLRKRQGSAREVTIQSDLSTTNLVADPELCSRFRIELAGCAAHARRPFALYEDQDLIRVPYMLHLFKGLALHEDCLDRCGRNRENVLAVRGKDSLPIWESIKALAHQLEEIWSKATPLGAAARYIIRHYEKLTAYLRDPRLEATNNLRERLLRTEKLIEKSSLFRRTIEGRVVLDIVRTILQTAVAADVPVQDYLIDVLRSDPAEVAEHPERYTPRAWSRRRSSAEA